MRVVVVGLGYTGKAAIRSLISCGVRHFHLVDGPEGTAPGSAEGLRASFPDANLTHRPGDATADPEGSWLVGSDMCLLTADSVAPDHCLAVNAACFSAGVPLLPGLGMGDVAQVGPRIVAGNGPCLQCIEIRVLAALGRRALAGGYPPNPRLAQTVGEMLAARTTRAGEAEDENPLVYVWSNGGSTKHLALRSPVCPTCATREPAPRYGVPTTLDLGAGATQDAGRILRIEPLIVDNVTGVVRWVTAYAPEPGEPRLAHAVASVAHPEWARAGQELYAGGSDLDADMARAAALGEALDRLATADPGSEHLRVTPYCEVAEEAIDPARFDLFHPETRRLPEFPYHEFDTSAPLTWVWSWSIARDRPALVPAWRVFTPLSSATPADRMDVINVSGCATGTSPAAAVLGGLLEVIERDTFMIAWAARLPVTGLTMDVDTPWDVGRYAVAFAEVGVDVRCSTVTLDWGVPVVFAIARSPRPGDPAAVVAAAADFDLASAARRALKELSANLAHVRHAMKVAPGPQSADVEHVRTQDHHALLYARPDMWGHLEPWWAPASYVTIPEPECASPAEVLSRVAERVTAAGYDVLAVDLGLTELRQRGVFTFKTLVPGAYQMNFDALWPHFGGKRMQQAPVDAGLLTEPVSFAALNRVPHPFP